MVTAILLGEICCDECGDICHTHFEECPVCKQPYAGTTHYGDPRDLELHEEIGCESCKADFVVKETSSRMNGYQWVLERVEE